MSGTTQRLNADSRRLSVDSYPLIVGARVLFSDVDCQQHINGGALMRYFEEGRATMNLGVFGRELLLDPEGERKLLFASTIVEYLRQGSYPGVLKIGTGISRIGQSSFVQSAAIFQSDQCIALSDSVTILSLNGRPTPLLDTHRHALAVMMLGGGETC